MGIEEILLYWSVIRKRLWLVLILVASTVGTILAISYTTPPVYVASVKFRIVSPPPADVELFTGRNDAREGRDSTLNSFIDNLKDRQVLRQVTEELGLSMSRAELQSLISVEELEIELESRANEDSGLIQVSVTYGDPELAADIVNTLINVALREFGEIRARSKVMSKEFIVSQLDITWQELSQAQNDMNRFQIENKVGELPQAIALQQGLIYDLRKQRDLAFAKGDLQEVANYDVLILERETELQNMVNLNSEYVRLETAVQQGKSTYQFLSEKITEAELKENETRTLSFIEVGSLSDVPSNPLPRVRTSILSLGTVLSLVVGIIIAFIWNYYETQPPPKKPSQNPERSITPIMP